MKKTLVGGCFAPPLSDETLAHYAATVAALPASPVKDAVGQLLSCCEKWWELPEPNGTKATAHAVGRGLVVEMEEGHKKALWDLIPWEHELGAMGLLFETLHPVEEREVRNLAFHLLWHVRELNLDREPITTDKL